MQDVLQPQPVLLAFKKEFVAHEKKQVMDVFRASFSMPVYAPNRFHRFEGMVVILAL